MAEIRQRHDWSRTSSLMALVANIHRDPRKHRAFRPGDFDPFSASARTTQRVGVSVLRDVFVRDQISRRRE